MPLIGADLKDHQMNPKDIQQNLRDIRNHDKKLNDTQRGIIEGIETSMARYGRITDEQANHLELIHRKVMK